MSNLSHASKGDEEACAKVKRPINWRLGFGSTLAEDIVDNGSSCEGWPQLAHRREARSMSLQEAVRVAIHVAFQVLL